MSVLVTGGAGFIGRHVVESLVARGDDVRVVDNLEPQVHGDTPHIAEFPPCEFVRADLRHAGNYGRILRGVHAVVHLAARVGVGQSAYEIHRYVDGNCGGTAALLQALAGRAIRRLVVASSMSLYGEGGPRPVSERHPLHPVSVYAVTKRDQEELCLAVGAAYGIPTLALRFFNVYGPGQALANPYTGVVSIFAQRLLHQMPPLIYEDGLQTRDFVHVSDVVRAVLAALDADSEVTGVLNVGTGTATTIAGLATHMAHVLQGPLPRMTGEYRSGDVRHCIADVSAIHAALGWRSTVTVEEGVTALVPYLRAQHLEVDRTEWAHRELTSRGLVRA